MRPGIRKPWHQETVHRDCGAEILTQQSHAEQTDINYIVARFQRTGELPPNPRGQEGKYVDCTPYAEDLTEAYNSATQRLEEAGRELAQSKEAKRKADEEQTRLLNEELAELRELKKSQPPKADGGSPKHQDTA